MTMSQSHNDDHIDDDLERYSRMMQAFETAASLIDSWNPMYQHGDVYAAVGSVAHERLSALGLSCKTLLLWH